MTLSETSKIRSPRSSLDSIDFLFASDVEVAPHPDERFRARTEDVLMEMLKEVKCEDEYSNEPAPLFIVFNGDVDARFDDRYSDIFKEIKRTAPCYYVFGNHECKILGCVEEWKRLLNMKSSYYSWRLSCTGITVTFIVLDLWSFEGVRKTHTGMKRCYEWSGERSFPIEEREWLKRLLDEQDGLKFVFAHAHMWCPPDMRPQDTAEIDELIKILKGTYDPYKPHGRANVFFNGGHHNYMSISKVDGVYFINPRVAIRGGYTRIKIHPASKRMDYLGRLLERSFTNLSLD